MIVRDDDQTRLQLLVQLKHEFENMLAVSGIEIARRLVSKYQLRPGDQGPSHGRTLASARSNIREAIALVLDIRDESAFDLFDTICLSDTELQAALDTARNMRRRAVDLDEKASNATLEAVEASVSSEDSLGMRDIAELLGISHQRVQQLATAVRRND